MSIFTVGLLLAVSSVHAAEGPKAAPVFPENFTAVVKRMFSSATPGRMDLGTPQKVYRKGSLVRIDDVYKNTMLGGEMLDFDHGAEYRLDRLGRVTGKQPLPPVFSEILNLGFPVGPHSLEKVGRDKGCTSYKVLLKLSDDEMKLWQGVQAELKVCLTDKGIPTNSLATTVEPNGRRWVNSTTFEKVVLGPPPAAVMGIPPRQP